MAALNQGTGIQIDDGGMGAPTNLGGAQHTGTVDANAGGLGGLFGQTRGYDVFTAPTTSDPSYAGNRRMISGLMGALPGQRAPQMNWASIAPVAGLPQDNRQMLGQLASSLFSSATGGGPSAAQAQFGMAADQNMQNAMAMAASAPGHGGNYAAAMKQAMNQRAAMTQQSALQSGQLRAQEMQSAQGQLGQLGGTIGNYDLGARQQDLGQAFNQAQLQQQAMSQNASMSLQQQQQMNELMQRYMQMGLTYDQANYQARVSQQQFNAQLLSDQMAHAMGISTQAAGQGVPVAGQMIGGATQALGALGSVASVA